MAAVGARFLGAALRVVRLLTVLAALAVAGLVLFAFAQKPSLEPRGSGAAPPPPEPPRIEKPETSPPLEPLDLRGTTPFVRRLEAGTELRRLARDVEERGAEAARLDARLERVSPLLLNADLRPPRLGGVRLLEVLTTPPRDLGSFTLAGATERDPLGKQLRVRAWTLGEAYPEEELATAAATLEHIVRCVDRDVEGGIDVLLTPALGNDVFPHQPRPPIERAAGLYFRGDQYCVVDSELRSGFRVEVVEHELIHAYCHRTARPFLRSRLITEGVAEYLRLVSHRDNGLNVPIERLRDSLAELAYLLEHLAKAGVDLRTVQPRRLVELDPDAFYQLGHLAYLIAQATMAYAGGDVIQLALYRRSDAPIREVIEGLDWREFLGFVERGSRLGRLGRAVIVDDAAPASRVERDRAGYAEALRKIGADVPEGLVEPVPMPGDVAATLGGEARLGLALRLLLAEPVAVRVFVDPSEEMDRGIRFAVPHAQAEILGLRPEGETARMAAARLAGFFGAARAGHVVTLGAPRRTGGAEILEVARPLAIGGFAEHPRDERRLAVLVVGSPGLAASVPAAPPDAAKPLEVLLVVDLTPDGQALRWAQAFDMPNRHVAYWAPLAD
jgi:hypothetical protein